MTDPRVIPYRLRAGVAGHRRLPDDPALVEQVRRALVRVRALTPCSPPTPSISASCPRSRRRTAALGAGGHHEAGAVTLGSVLIFLAIVLPAFAGALSGIHVQREFHRNAERYGRMAPYLLAIERRIAASDRASIRALAQEVADLMLNENSDWFTVMRFRDFELPV